MSETPLEGLGLGKFTATLYPIYAGVVNNLGQEPISSSLYKRGMIRWDTMPNGELVGRVDVDVPAGTWVWAIYCFHPTLPTFYAVEKLAQAWTLTSAGKISLDCITTENIKPNADPLGALPD